ncbi:GFA family protein [Dyella sp. 20L07]|uniref:GFA family protein n=1 Tax=Dyella sp. 20L07 TaxID=3384240 RepID=UPI003D26D816
MLIHGQCHCGNISFQFTLEPDPSEIPARACDCSFCVKHGGVWTANPDASLHVTVKDASLLSRYAFGTHTAEFLTCARCGVVPVVLSQIDGELHAVVSINAMENLDPALLNRATVNFDGEDGTSRLARRKRYWINKVTYSEG